MSTPSVSFALSLCVTCVTLFGCGASPQDQPSSNGSTSTTATTTSSDNAVTETRSSTTIATGLTSDFQSFLATRYPSDDFVRGDVPGGSFGGRTTAGQALAHTPIVFVHGNSDSALGTGTALTTGWVASTSYFLSQGYTSAELYGTTWGPANEDDASLQTHSRAYVGFTRRFLQAVLAYTGASKIDVISHSMGVTMSRAAILGGTTVDDQGSYDIGPSIGGSVDTFIGIAGANLGLTNCYSTEALPTCDDVAGFYPGVLLYGVVEERSKFLTTLYGHKGGEGSYRYAIFSTVDEVIEYGDVVYGQYTSELPGETGVKIYDSAPYGHIGSKDDTGDEQYKMVTAHKT